MIIRCVWEHNGEDSILYAVDYPGAFTRGETLEAAKRKMSGEIGSFCAWSGIPAPIIGGIEIVQEAVCTLCVRDADSDVLFEAEKAPLTEQEYMQLKALVLRSAADFLTLYEAVPDQEIALAPPRSTFYGQVPATAREMYEHTKSVNAYYFAEIGVKADHDGDILCCRRRGFEALERQMGYLENTVIDGSYGESWTLRKMLRRFLWHDRIHARAMYRRAVQTWGGEAVPDVFAFAGTI